VFTAAGIFPVSLSVTNPYGTDSVTRDAFINATPPPPFIAGWSNRTQHMITGSTAADVTDYQVRFHVHRSGGADSGEDLYSGTRVKPDYSDLRYTTDTNTLIPYRI